MLIFDMPSCVCKQQQSCIRRQQMCNFNVSYSMTNKLHAIGNLTPLNDTLTGGDSDVLPFYPLDASKSVQTLQLVSAADLVPVFKAAIS